MAAMDTAHKLEIKQETTRIRGEEFEKWQRESVKIEKMRAQKAKIATKQDLEKKKEREKAQI